MCAHASIVVRSWPIPLLLSWAFIVLAYEICGRGGLGVAERGWCHIPFLVFPAILAYPHVV